MSSNEQETTAPGSQFSPPAEAEDTRSTTPEETIQELDDAIEGSKEILATATTFVPLFPDTITVDRAKLSITKRRFFGSAELISMRIEDVLNVTDSHGPIFGTLCINSRVINSEPLEVHGFLRKDATRIKRIAQGYVIALQRNIDCSALPAKELSDKLFQLGEDDHTGA